MALCRYKGGIRADQLQQFAADKLFELPQVPTVTRHSLAKFLAGVPQHKTTLLAFSKTAGASMALRQAVQQTDMLIRAGRVQWKSEVWVPPTLDGEVVTSHLGPAYIACHQKSVIDRCSNEASYAAF